MKNKNTSVHEPLFHVVKRDVLPVWKSMLIRVVAVAAALLLCSVLSMVLINADPIEFIETLIDATFGSSRRLWKFSKDAAVLLIAAAIEDGNGGNEHQRNAQPHQMGGAEMAPA